MGYIHKQPPWAHQSTAFELSRDREEFALFMEQRTGKSKVLIDTSAWLYAHGAIDALLLIAPNGVDEDWLNYQMTDHWPDWAGTPVMAHWEGKLLKKEEAALYDPARSTSFHVLAMNTEAFRSSPRARAAAEKFLRIFRCMMAVDESSGLKDPSSAQTKSLIKLGRLAKYRRILTGTPSTQSPLDIYAQFKFLNPHLLGYQSYYAFKANFAELLPENHGLMRSIMEKMPEHMKRRGVVPQVIAKDQVTNRPKYKNIDELQRLIAPHCFRITRAECGDMPDKLYDVRSVPLTDEQADLYQTASEEMILESLHGTLTIANQLSRLMRLQQIIGGFLPRDNAPPAAISCNRFTSLMNEIEQMRGRVIIWARFRPELARIAELLRENYGAYSVGEYHGGVDGDARKIVRADFQNLESPLRFFVGQQSVGSYGLKLTAASDMIYYSNDFSLEHRMQSEDRPLALDKKDPTSYLDLISPGTVDVKIAEALRGKKEVADALLDSGGLRAWIK